MKYLRPVICFLGLIATYYCMSLWGMGISNPVKYYLYGIVIMFSFGVIRELQQFMVISQPDSFSRHFLFLITGTLILAGLTIAMFSQYEMFVFKQWIHRELQHYPGQHLKSLFSIP